MQIDISFSRVASVSSTTPSTSSSRARSNPSLFYRIFNANVSQILIYEFTIAYACFDAAVGKVKGTKRNLSSSLWYPLTLLHPKQFPLPLDHANVLASRCFVRFKWQISSSRFGLVFLSLCSRVLFLYLLRSLLCISSNASLIQRVAARPEGVVRQVQRYEFLLIREKETKDRSEGRERGRGIESKNQRLCARWQSEMLLFMEKLLICVLRARSLLHPGFLPHLCDGPYVELS